MIKIAWLRFVIVAAALLGIQTATAKTVNTVYSKKNVDYTKDTFLIIGAGASGLTAARTLLSAKVPSQNIIIVESEKNAGGKVSSTIVDGLPFEMGAQMIIPVNYKVIENLRDEFGMKTTPLQRGFFFDIENGEVTPTLTKDEVPKFIEQRDRYLKYYSEVWHQNSPDSPYRLLDADGLIKVHPDLDKSWPQFVKDNDFEILEKVFISLLGGSGFEYDDFNPRHAARIVRALRPDLIDNLLVKGRPVEIFEGEGFQGLWKAVANKLALAGVQIRYNHRVERIIPKSSGGQTDVQVRSGDVRKILKTDHVIYTANTKYLPQMVKKSKQLGYEVFKNATDSDYRAFLVKVAGISSLNAKSGSIAIKPYIQPITDSQGQSAFIIGKPVLLVKPYVQSDIVVIYAHGSKSISNVEIEKEISLMFDRLGGIATILMSSNWAYRPKFRGNELSSIKTAMKLQGRGGIWFMGEIFSFGGVQEVYENAEAFTTMLLSNKL